MADSPDQRYATDADFRLLVDTMISAIMRCDYTPSEMRQAAILASIKVEMMRPAHSFVISRKEADALGLRIEE